MKEAKINLTQETIDDFEVKAYNKISELKEDNKILEKQILELKYSVNELTKKFSELKKEYKEINLLNIGKGKYYPIYKEEIDIKSKIASLENDAYDDYHKKVDEEALKKKNDLLPVLKEDLENIEEKIKELKKYMEEVIEKYNKLNKYIKDQKKSIKEKEFQILRNEKLIKKLTEQIKRIEKYYKLGKKVKKRTLKI